MKPNLTNLKPTLTTPSNQTEIKKVQEEVWKDGNDEAVTKAQALHKAIN